MKKYTVIGFYDDNQYIFSHHLMAVDHHEAFAKVAEEFPQAILVATLQGWQDEGESVHFPGMGIMGAQEYTDRMLNGLHEK